MAHIDGEWPLGGPGGDVEADETYIGGKTAGGKRGRGAPNKTVVFGMLERGGDVMAKVIPNVKKRTLHPIVAENVEPGSTIHTDELRSYWGLDRAGYQHRTVNHGAGEYVRHGSHVNAIEGFWGSPETVDPRDPRSRFGEAPSEVCKGVRVSLQPAPAVGRDLRRFGSELLTAAFNSASKRDHANLGWVAVAIRLIWHQPASCNFSR